MDLSGLSPDGRLVEIAELRDHPFYLGSQFHPEFKSRPERPHPLFRDFVGAAWRRAADYLMPVEQDEAGIKAVVDEVAVPAPNQ
jgi:CTP synthase